MALGGKELRNCTKRQMIPGRGEEGQRLVKKHLGTGACPLPSQYTPMLAKFILLKEFPPCIHQDLLSHLT